MEQWQQFLGSISLDRSSEYKLSPCDHTSIKVHNGPHKCKCLQFSDTVVLLSIITCIYNWVALLINLNFRPIPFMLSVSNTNGWSNTVRGEILVG